MSDEVPIEIERIILLIIFISQVQLPFWGPSYNPKFKHFWWLTVVKSNFLPSSVSLGWEAPLLCTFIQARNNMRPLKSSYLVFPWAQSSPVFEIDHLSTFITPTERAASSAKTAVKGVGQNCLSSEGHTRPVRRVQIWLPYVGSQTGSLLL